MNGHNRYVCKHGTVVSQCRCMERHTDVLVPCLPTCPQDVTMELNDKHPIHYIYKCREHGRVLMQCKCIGEKKVVETACALSCSDPQFGKAATKP